MDALKMAMMKQQMDVAECAGTTLRPYNPTLRERLLTQKADLTQRLADLDAAITALDNNPNFEEVVNLIGKVHY